MTRLGEAMGPNIVDPTRIDGRLRAIDAWMEAVVGCNDWVEPLRESASALYARAAVVSRFDPSTGRSFLDIGPEATPDFVRLCREISFAVPGRVVERDEPALGRVTGVKVQLQDDAGGWLALFSLSDSAVDISLFQEIAAVAACSVAARSRLGATWATSSLKTAVFDHLPFAVAIVDSDIRVIEGNEACRALAARAEGLSVRQDILVCHDQIDHAELTRAVSRALSGESTSGVVHVHRPRGAQPLVVRVVASRGEADPNHCLLMIVDPDEELAAGCDIWRVMFDLTECELVIAEGLVSGRRINDIASQRGVSIETVRSQSKRMFERPSISGLAEVRLPTRLV